MLWRLHGGYAGSPELAPHELYHSIGIWKLVPGEPAAALLGVLWWIGAASTIAMIIGLWSRAATAVSFVAAVALASYEYSFAPSWSHDNNAPLLAQLAFLGAYGGDAWSIDAWWRHRRGVAPAEHTYLWSVLLVQLALALMMASAAYTKLVSGGLSLSWVLSDNLRNQILIRFDLTGLPRTAIADWLVDSPVRWKMAAALNILAQLAPLAACFAIRRPVLRMMLGGLFAVETVGLDLVMGFSNYHWLPLVAAFVDWDWLLARVGRSGKRMMPHDRDLATVPVSRSIRIYVIGFVICDAVIAFWRWPKIDQRIGAYPLSAFPMFASVRARPPFGEHQTYEIVESAFEVVSAPPPSPLAQSFIDTHPGARKLGARSPAVIRSALADFDSEFHTAFPEFAIQSVRVRVVAIRAAPYPEPARLDRATIATLAELAADGTFRCMLGRLVPTGERWVAVPSPLGLPATERFAVYSNGGFTDFVGSIELPANVHVVARVDVPGEGERTFVVGVFGSAD